MAISGTFLADFQSFYAAAQQAEVHLKSFEGGAGKVESALNRMVDNFSGRKIIQDATLMTEAFDRLQKEGIKLTEDELQKMATVAAQAAEKLRAMGVDVPPQMQALANEVKHAGDGLTSFKSTVLEVAGALGIAFSVGAIVQWGKAMLDSVVLAAGALVDLNAKSDVSIEQLQRFAFVGKQANVSVEDFAQSSFKLGVALAGGSGSVRKGVEDLGLSYDKLRTQSPDEQFNQTIAALERMVDPTERNRIGVELFGKSFATIAPAVAKGYAEMAAQAQVSSAAQIKAIDDASDAWDRWVAKQKASITSSLGDLLLMRKGFSELSEEQKRFLIDTTGGGAAFNKALRDHATALDLVLPPMKAATAGTVDYVKQLALAEQQVAKLTTVQTAGIAAALKMGESHDKIAVAFHLSDEALALFVERQRTATTQLEEFQTSATNLLPILNNPAWDGTTQSALKLGAAVHDVAVYFGQSEGAINSQAQALKHAADAQLELTRLQTEFTTRAITQSGTRTQIEIANIDRTYENLKASLTKSGALSAEVAAQLTKNWAQALTAVGADWSALRDQSIETLEDTAKRAQATFDAMQTSGLHYRRDAIDHFRAVRDEAFIALHQTGAEHAAEFKHMTEEVDRTSFAYRNWLANVATDAEKAQIALTGIAGQTRAAAKAAEEAAVAYKKMMEMGNSITYDLSTPEGIDVYRKLNPGASIQWSDDQIIAYIKNGGNLASLIGSGIINPYAALARGNPQAVHTFEEGGPTGAGGLAMLHPDEFVVPKGGALVGGGGGGTLTIQVMLPDGRVLAEVVAEHLFQQSAVKLSRH